MVKVLHLSDIHLGSGFSHGKIDPDTGLNTRLLDFIGTLRRCIDRALAEPVDLVLFGGDAFPDATPAPYIAEAFAREFHRLAEANIPTVLLVGNHDRYSLADGSASLGIYRTLAVPNFIVGDRLDLHRISTRSGPIQVITLPWLTSSTLLTRPESQGLSIAEINELLAERLRIALEGEIRKRDRDCPTILLGHLMSDKAKFGAERLLAVSKGFTIPLSLLVRQEFDYVALGHVHKHQNLNPSNDPPVIYPGSIERVDFSEEKEEKGYILADVTIGGCNWEFCPLPVRAFLTLSIDVSEADDPQAMLLKALNKSDIGDRVVRLRYKLRADQLDRINTSELRKALKSAHSATIQPELISQLSRPRIPSLSGRAIDPLDALHAYLDNREDLRDIREDVVKAAEHLLHEEQLPLFRQSS